MSRFLDFLESQLPEEGTSVSPVDNILYGKSYYRKTSLTYPLSDLSYYLTILDDGSFGFSYFHGESLNDATLLSAVNKPPTEVLKSNKIDLPFRVSLLDAMYHGLNEEKGIKPSKVITGKGNYHDKALLRAQLVTKSIKPQSKVLMIGLVTEFVTELTKKQATIFLTDRSPGLKNKFAGIKIIGHEKEETHKALAEADYVLVTGAVFTSDTIDEILEIAKKNNTKLIFYLETGSSFASYLIQKGASLIVAEKFPFYDLPGDTKFEIYE